MPRVLAGFTGFWPTVPRPAAPPPHPARLHAFHMSDKRVVNAENTSAEDWAVAPRRGRAPNQDRALSLAPTAHGSRASGTNAQGRRQPAGSRDRGRGLSGRTERCHLETRSTVSFTKASMAGDTSKA